jgi:transposase-like protein
MAEQVQVELEVETKQAEKNVDDLTGGIKNLTKAVEQGNEQTAAGLKSIEETSKSTGEGVKGIGNAIKAAGVGLFLIALESMKELFMQNQQVADAVSGAFEGLALVFNDVFGFVTGGVESVQKLGDAFDKYFGKPIQTATQAFEKFGDAFSKIFGGDFSGALESAKEGFSGLGDAISQTGDGFVEAATDVAEYVVDIKDAAVANVQLAKAAEKAEVINAGLLEKYDRQAEQQRQIRDEERNSITERIAANEKLGKLLEEQNKVMLENANIVLKAAEVAFARNGSLENEIALITAKNEVMAVEATVEGFRSEQKANDLALDRERIELINTEKESVSTLGFEKRKFDAEQEESDILRIEKLRKINEEEKIAQETRLQGIIDEANIGTQARVDAEIALNEFLESNYQERIGLTNELKDAELAADIAVKESTIAKIGVLQSGLGALKGMAEGNLKLQKAIIVAEAAASIGQIIMSTQIANAKASAASPLTFGMPWVAINSANAVIGIAATIASSKKALSAIGKGGSIASETSPSAIGGSGSAQMESQAPEFNIVGTSGVNQIADVVASQAPVKAYVVANDVTTAQALDRNIVESATL